MHLEFEGWDGCFEGPSNDEGTDQLEDWEKHTEDGYDISHEEWERRDEIGRQKALFDYSIYKEWDQIVGPHFSNVIGFPCSSDYPFHRLETLSLRVDEVSEWYLIFSTDSFPSLRYLKLLGIFCDLDGIEYIVSTWRYSVTQYVSFALFSLDASHSCFRTFPTVVQDVYSLRGSATNSAHMQTIHSS